MAPGCRRGVIFEGEKIEFLGLVVSSILVYGIYLDVPAWDGDRINGLVMSPSYKWDILGL